MAHLPTRLRLPHPSGSRSVFDNGYSGSDNCEDCEVDDYRNENGAVDAGGAATARAIGSSTANGSDRDDVKSDRQEINRDDDCSDSDD